MDSGIDWGRAAGEQVHGSAASQQGRRVVTATLDEDCSFLVFGIQSLQCALFQQMVRAEETLGELEPPAPGLPPYCVGGMEISGAVTQLVDLRRRVFGEDAHVSGTANVVTIDSPGQPFGFVVDGIIKTQTLPAGTSVYEVPAEATDRYGLCFNGMFIDPLLGEVYILCPRSALGELYGLTDHGCGGRCH